MVLLLKAQILYVKIQSKGEKMKTAILIIFILIFTGCEMSSSDSKESLDSSITPQPSVEDESLRPPKPPSI